MPSEPRASKSLRAHVRRLKATARREGRPVPYLRYNKTRGEWEIQSGG